MQLPPTLHTCRNTRCGAQAQRRTVNVGLAVPLIGKTDEPSTDKLSWSWLGQSAPTTEVSGSAPIRVILSILSILKTRSRSRGHPRISVMQSA
ncbi:MAG: hypothetical protein ACI8PT_002903 [Gammaproteobacteria bacterium]|jgi:hypothetical protein